MANQPHFNPTPKSTSNHPKAPEPIKRDDLDAAIKDFQKRGGQIKKVEPFWIEEPTPQGYQSQK